MATPSKVSGQGAEERCAGCTHSAACNKNGGRQRALVAGEEVADQRNGNGPEKCFSHSQPEPEDDDIPFNFGVTVGPGGPSFSFGIGDAPPPAPVPVTPEVCFFKGNNFSGAQFCVNPGDDDATLPGGWNDSISSISIEGGAQVTVCKDFWYAGSCTTYSNDKPSLGSYNNAISSYQAF